MGRSKRGKGKNRRAGGGSPQTPAGTEQKIEGASASKSAFSFGAAPSAAAPAAAGATFMFGVGADGGASSSTTPASTFVFGAGSATTTPATPPTGGFGATPAPAAGGFGFGGFAGASPFAFGGFGIGTEGPTTTKPPLGNGDDADAVYMDIDNLPVDVNTPPPFCLGTRVEVLPDCTSEFVTGTVTEHWVKGAPGWPKNKVAPYLVRLDDGKPMVVYGLGLGCIRRSDAPPLKIVHDLGSRVECKLGSKDGELFPDCDGEWFSGTITHVDVEWRQRDMSPYKILLDDGRNISFWGPQDCIRASSDAPPEKQHTDLRFRVGDRVACKVGPNDDDWSDGTIIELWYKQHAGFADGYAAPYSIQLDSRGRIFAPYDDDGCIRRSDVPPPQCWICFDNDLSEDNLIVRECNCRGEQNGFAHINCLVQFAQTKVEGRDPDHRLNPFRQCITCKRKFNPNSLCAMALARAYFDTYEGRDIRDECKRNSITHLSELLMEDEEYPQASNLLRELISNVRLETERGSIMLQRYWRGALATYLSMLAEVYCKMGSLSAMKSVLDELRSIIDTEGLVPLKMRSLNLAAMHAYDSGDKREAPEYLEEARAFVKECNKSANSAVVGLWLSCGNLHLEYGNKELGLELISQAAQTIESMHGRECPQVRNANKFIRMIEQGQLDKIPSHGMTVPL